LGGIAIESLSANLRQSVVKNTRSLAKHKIPACAKAAAFSSKRVKMVSTPGG